MQLPALGDDVQHAARGHLPERHHPPGVLDVGHLLGWHVQLRAHRHHLLVRVQWWRLQRRPVRERDVQHASGE